MHVFCAGLPTHSRTCRDQAKSQMSLLLGDDCVNNAVHSLFHVMLCVGLLLTHHSMKPQFIIADCECIHYVCICLPPAIVSLQTVAVVNTNACLQSGYTIKHDVTSRISLPLKCNVRKSSLLAVAASLSDLMDNTFTKHCHVEITCHM